MSVGSWILLRYTGLWSKHVCHCEGK